MIEFLLQLLKHLTKTSPTQTKTTFEKSTPSLSDFAKRRLTLMPIRAISQIKGIQYLKIE